MANFFHGTVTVNASADLVATPSASSQIIVKNSGPNVAYLGGSTVTADQTSTGGLPLAPGDAVTLVNVTIARDLFAVTASGDAVISWLAASI